jgi:hypothetical protein
MRPDFMTTHISVMVIAVIESKAVCSSGVFVPAGAARVTIFDGLEQLWHLMIMVDVRMIVDTTFLTTLVGIPEILVLTVVEQTNVVV